MTEAGFDFVEDEDETRFGGEIAEALQISGGGLHDADVLQDGFEDDRGDGVLRGDATNRFEVVEVDGVYELTVRGGDAGADRVELVFAGDARTEFGEGRCEIAGDVVVPAVVAALHDDDVVATGGGAGEADGLIGGFAAGVEESYGLDEGSALADQFCEAGFERGGAAAVQTLILLEGADNRLVDVGVVVAEDVRAEGGVVVDVSLAVAVPHVRAAGTDEDEVGLGDAIYRGDAAGEIASAGFDGSF